MESKSKRSLRTGEGRGGFTLFELLVVFAVMAVLLGIGAAYLVGSSRGFQLESEAGRIMTLLHVVRNLAVDTGNPAVLHFTKNGSVTVMAYRGRRVTDYYPMEDVAGAFGRTFTTAGGEFVPGVVGKCLHLEDGESADLGNNPRWGFEEGFAVDLFVKVVSLPGEAELLKKENQFVLSLVPAGGPLVYVKAAVTLEDSSVETVENPAVTWDRDRWVRIGFSCMGGEAVLSVDGVPVKEYAFSGRCSSDTSGKMTIMEGSSGCELYVDELVLSRWGTLGEESLAPRVCISGLEARLKDADPTNDFLDINPDGTSGQGGALSQDVYYEGKPTKRVTICIGVTGNIYKE